VGTESGLARAALLLLAAGLAPVHAQVELLEWLDRDGDGRVEPYEGAEALLFLAEVADTDGDGAVDADEVAAFLRGEEDHAEDLEAMIEDEVRGLLEDFDRDGDGAVSMREIPRRAREELSELDLDGDGRITAEELRALLLEELRGAEFHVQGTRAVMEGTIGPSTPGRVLRLLLEHPEVDTLVLADVPGSMDDESNLRAARLVRRAGLTTVVPYDGMIASGGVDLFLAGATRRLGPHARVGVHSWAGGEGPRGEMLQGADLPRDHPEHEMFVEYYADMEVHEDFYWFTLEAAPAEDIHWMTMVELVRFGVATEPWDFADEVLPLGDPYGLEAIDVGAAPRGIAPLPAAVDPVLRAHFDRYARVVAPNGRPIHLLAQPPWTADQIVHARKVLEHLLVGHADVANAMTERRATLVLFSTQDAMEEALHGPLGELELGMQDLRANECPAPGSPDYMAHETRDAAYEEILHLVHQHGIRPALPEYDAALQEASDAAQAAGLWEPWPEEEPGSFRYEYVAAVYDNYLDLWTVAPTRYEGQSIRGEVPEGESHFGRYRAGSRARLAELDPRALELIEAYFPPALTYTAELPADFEGVFSLTHDPALRYTTKTQHLRHVRLQGGAATLIGNDHANTLTGASGDDVLEGRGGDDHLVGGEGRDVAMLRGAREAYAVTREGDVTLVRGPDGVDRLEGVEVLRFADGELLLE